MNRNILYLVVGALVVAAGVFLYMLYQERQKTTGIEINVRQKWSFYREEIVLQFPDDASMVRHRWMPMTAHRCWSKMFNYW